MHLKDGRGGGGDVEGNIDEKEVRNGSQKQGNREGK
jgi:hypothetical protein